jgi:hypothetical protein
MDDFAVKYVGKDNAHHLRNSLLCHYEITTDWGGTVCLGMTLKWDYHRRTCDIFMPGYVRELAPVKVATMPRSTALDVARLKNASMAAPARSSSAGCATAALVYPDSEAVYP